MTHSTKTSACNTCNGYGVICCGKHNNDACQGGCQIECPECPECPECLPIRLREVIGKMTALAGAGVCNSGIVAKHGFHQEILDLGKNQGFNILGISND